MKDSRRDKTAAIPPATLAELRASREKLAKSFASHPDSASTSSTAIPSTSGHYGAPRAPELAQHVVWQPPREPLDEGEWKESLRRELAPFDPDCRAAFVHKLALRAYVAALLPIDQAAKLDSGNAALTKAARVLRELALQMVEEDVGGPDGIVRLLQPLSTIDAPLPLEKMLRLVDGKTSTEQLIRVARVNRLSALDLLADLARSGHIEILTLPPTETEERLDVDHQLEKAAYAHRATPSSQPPPRSSKRQITWKGLGSQPLENAEGEARSVDDAPDEMASLLQPLPVIDIGPGDAAPASTPPLESSNSVSSPPSAAPARPSEIRLRAPASARRAPPKPPPYAILAVGGLVAVGAIVIVVALATGPSEPSAASAPVEQQPARTPLPTTQPTVVVPPLKTSPPQASRAVQDGAPTTLRLKINVEPRFARVLLDGVLLTPPYDLTIMKDQKDHEVTFESNGFRTKKSTFKADSDATLIVSLELTGRRATGSAAPQK